MDGRISKVHSAPPVVITDGRAMDLRGDGRYVIAGLIAAAALPAAVFLAAIPFYVAVPISIVLFGAIVFLLAPRRPLEGINADAVGRGQIEAAQNALEEADRDLDSITVAAKRIRTRDIAAALDHLTVTARRLLHHVEQDPAKLSEVRRLVAVYLPRTREIATSFADIESRGPTRAAADRSPARRPEEDRRDLPAFRRAHGGERGPRTRRRAQSRGRQHQAGIGNAEMSLTRRQIGLGLLGGAVALTGGGLYLRDHNPFFKPEPLKLFGFIGGEKKLLLSNEKIKALLADTFGFTLDARQAGSVEMVREPSLLQQNPQFLWPSSDVMVEIAKQSHVKIQKSQVIVNSPIVIYSWEPVAEGLMKAGIVASIRTITSSSIRES